MRTEQYDEGWREGRKALLDEVEEWLVTDAGIGPYDLAEFRERFGASDDDALDGGAS